MQHAEIAIIHYGIDDVDHPPTMFGIHSDTRIGPREFRFESENGSGFTILEGERYTIQYVGEPLKAEHGQVRKVHGRAVRDEAGHLLLTESTIIYHKQSDPKAPHPTTFVTGYIPGIRIVRGNAVVYEWPIEKPRIARLIDALWKKTPINLLGEAKAKFPNSAQYPTT